MKTFASPANVNPIAVVQGGDGCVYVGGNNGVAKYAANGDLLKADFITGSSVTLVTGLGWYDNKLWVTDYFGYTAAHDPTSGSQSGPSVTIGGNPFAVGFGPDGLAYVGTLGSGELLSWDTATGVVTQLAASGDPLLGLAWVGNDLYVTGNSPALYKYVPQTGLVPWASGHTGGIGLAAYGGTLYRGAGNSVDAGWIDAFNLADGSTVYSKDIASTTVWQQHLCVLVPEPSSLLALFGGAGGLCAWVARRRRS